MSSPSPEPVAAGQPIEHRWPVSVKGVVIAENHVLLLGNEREEWELPGGRLEVGESPEQCVVREIREETGLNVAVDRLLDCWVYPIRPDHRVLIVTYRCHDLDRLDPLSVSAEHRAAAWVPIGSLDDDKLPAGYRRSIVGDL